MKAITLNIKPVLYGLGVTLVLIVVAFSFSLSSNPPSAYEVACGMPLREKLCFLDSQSVAECGLEDERFNVLEGRIAGVFEAAPEQVKGKMCTTSAFVVAHPSNGIEPWVGAFTNYEIIGINLTLWQNIFTPFESFLHGMLTGYIGEKRFNSIKDAEFIKIEMDEQSDFQPGLNYTLAQMIFHEVAHLVEADLKEPAFHCLPKPDEQQDLPLIEPEASAYCEKYLHPEQDFTLLEKLQNSDMVSLYATCSKAEDFAETYTAYIMSEHLNRNFTATIDGREIFNSAHHLQSEKLKGKVNTIKTILNFGKLTDGKKLQMSKEHKTCTGRFSLASN